MYNWITNSPICATIVIGTGSIVVAKLMFSAFKYVCAKVDESNGKVHDVLIFNEESPSCFVQRQYGKPYRCTRKYCTKHHINRIVAEIQHAQYSIDICIYTFTLLEIADAFKEALERGVFIRLITDYEMICSHGSQITALNKLGVECRSPDTTAMMHHKFMIIDGEARVKEIMRLKEGKLKPRPFLSILINGSINWTMQGFCGNWENCYITSIKTETIAFQTEFDRMWKAFENSKNNHL